MPNQTSNQTALRRDGHKRRVYLSDLSGTVVATYEVTSTPAVVSALNVATTLISGAASAVKHGMRAVVETGAGQPRGVLNVRSNGTISSSNLPLREFSRGHVAIATGDIIKIYDDFPLIDKLTAANETFAPDYEPYVDQFSDPRPLAGSGGHYAGWLAASSAVPTDGSASLNLDPDTANTLTHAWVATGGTVSSSSAQSPTIDFSSVGAGSYRVDHTVTAANGKTRAQSTRYCIHDADDPPFSGTEEGPLQADPVNGWSYGIRVYDEAAFHLSPLAPVVVWVDETINGTRQSFGAKAAGRSHIKCMGYLRRARSGWDASAGLFYVTYDIVSALQMLNELPGFSKVFQYDQSPASWSEQKTLTHRRAWLYLVLYYTNANEAGHDLALDDGGMMDMLYSAFFLQKTDPLGQWRELAGGADCRITCDRTGRIECQQRLECIPFASRGAVTTTLALTTADIAAYEMDHDFKEPVETYRARGFTAGSTNNKPLFARWPASPGYGNQSDTDEKLVCVDTADHYTRTALRGAYANRTFTNSDRVKRHAPSMKVRLPGSYDVFDLYKEWVGVVITDDPRIGDTSVFRWMVETISYAWEGGTGAYELTLQAETNGYDAVDDTPPTSENNGLPPWTPDWQIFDPFPLIPEQVANFISAGTQSLGGWNTDGYFYYCVPALTGRGFDVPAASGGPFWARVSAGAAAAVIDSVQSAFTTTRDVLVTADAAGIYTADNVGPSPTITLRKTLRAAITNQLLQWRMVEASFGAEIIDVVSYYGNSGADSGTWRTRSVDGGLTWSTEVNVTAHYGSSTGANVPGLFLSSRAPGQTLFGVFTASGADVSANAVVIQVTGTGGGGTNVVTLADAPAYCIHKSWADNEATMYYSTVDFAFDAANRNRVYRKVGAGAAVDITPIIGGSKQRLLHTRSLHTCPVDANTVLMAVGGNGASGVLMSRNKGTTQFLLTPGTTTDYNGAEVAGNNPNLGYVWGSSGAIGHVDLATQTIDDRRGNIVTDFPGIGRFTRIRGL